MSKDWSPNTERFVAFIDILGFKNMVDRMEHDELYRKLQQLAIFLDEVVRPDLKKMGEQFSGVDVRVTNFSDSIIVFSKSNTPEDFLVITYALKFIFCKAIETEIPLKGAMSYGKCTVNQSRKIYFGKSIIDAYQTEEQVKYLGLVLHPSVANYLNNSRSFSGMLKKDYLFVETPLRHGRASNWNLNWFEAMRRHLDLPLEHFNWEAIFDPLKRSASTDSGRLYYSNTFELMSASGTR
jgi:hypothetical protein